MDYSWQLKIIRNEKKKQYLKSIDLKIIDKDKKNPDELVCGMLEDTSVDKMEDFIIDQKYIDELNRKYFSKQLR